MFLNTISNVKIISYSLKHDTPPHWHFPWFFQTSRWNPKANASFSLAFHASSAGTSVTVLPTLLCRWVCVSLPFRLARMLFPDLSSVPKTCNLTRPHSVLLCKGCWEHTSACTDEDHASSRCYCIHCDSSLDCRCQLLEGLCSRLQNPALSNTDIGKRRNKTSRTKRVRVRDRVREEIVHFWEIFSIMHYPVHENIGIRFKISETLQREVCSNDELRLIIITELKT